MTNPRISTRSLLRETFATAKPLYPSLLTINSPRLIFRAIKSFGILGSAGVAFNIIYSFVVIPLLSGAMIFYTYQSLNRNQVTVGQAFNQANRRFLHLVLVYIIFFLLVFAGFIALVIPGIYVSYRLIFSGYATVIDNSSPLDSLNRSWELTKGRWWLVFRSVLLLILVIFVPGLLLSLLIGSTGNLLASKLVGNLLGFLATPSITVYFVLLYLRLRESPATIQ